MSEHTKEPWHCYPISEGFAVEHSYGDGTIEEIAEVYSDNPHDARRIVACVNYCEGIRTDVMEALVPNYGGITALMNVGRLIEQRDQLLAALKDARDSLGAFKYCRGGELWEAHDEAAMQSASAAIAACT